MSQTPLQPKNFFDLGEDIAQIYEALDNTNKFTDDEKEKIGHLIVTGAIDLDALKARVDGLSSAIVLSGDWDASIGNFPGGGSAAAGQAFIVTGDGAVAGRQFARGDRIIALVDNASTVAYDGQWFHDDNTDQVRSVANLGGDITAAQLLAELGVEAGATQNSPDAALLARGNHTGTQPPSTIEGLDDYITTRIDATLVAGDNITITPQGAQRVIAATGGPPAPTIPVAQIADIPGDDPALSRWLLMTTFGPTPEDFDNNASATFSRSEWFRRQFDPTHYPIRSIANAQMTESLLADRENRSVTPNGENWERFISLDIMNGGSPFINRAAYAMQHWIVCSYVNSDVQPRHLTHWYDLLRANMGGTIVQLLQDVSLNRAMAIYLTFFDKRKADPVSGIRPDQNYARELLQLFTLGTVELDEDGAVRLDGENMPIPTYTQEDIAQLARLFTGWVNPGMQQSAYDAKHSSTRDPQWDWNTTSFQSGVSQAIDGTQPLYCFTDEHEWGASSFLGITIPAVTDPGQQTVEAARNQVRFAVEQICALPSFLPFTALRMIKFLTKENPSASYVQHVVDAGKAGEYQLPDGSTIGSGAYSDLRAMWAAVLFHNEGVAVNFADATAGRVRTNYEQAIRLNRFCSGKNNIIPASTNPPTLRDLLERDNAASFTEHIHFSNQDPRSRGFFSQPSVFGWGRPLYIDTGSAAGDAGLETPGLQGFNWSELNDLWNDFAWASQGNRSYQRSIFEGFGIGGNVAALNALAAADQSVFINTYINDRLSGGLLPANLVALLTQEATNRLTTENNTSRDDARSYNVSSRGGPSCGSVGLVFLALMSTRNWVRR